MVLDDEAVAQMVVESRRFDGDGSAIMQHALYELALGFAAQAGRGQASARDVRDAGVRIRQIIMAAGTITIEGN